MFCRKCGSENPDNAVFCKNCGSPLRGATGGGYEYNTNSGTVNSASVQSDMMAPKKSKLPFIIGGAAGVLIVLLVLIGVLFFGFGGMGKKFNEQLELGQKYILEEDYDMAIEALRKAIEIDPKNVKPYILLADAYVRAEMYEDAVQVLYEAQSAGVKDKNGEIENKLQSVIILRDNQAFRLGR